MIHTARKRLLAERKVFQSQLAALLEKGIPFVEAVGLIEGKAPASLAERIRQARARGGDTGRLLEGLAELGLVPPDFALLAGWLGTPKLDAEAFLRAQLSNELTGDATNEQLKRQLYRIISLFGATLFVAVVLYELYVVRIYPMLAQIKEVESLSVPWPVRLAEAAGFVAIAVLIALLAGLYGALRVDSARQWRVYRIFWLSPVTRGLFTKLATWRTFSRCQLLMSAGLPAPEAMELALRSYGLRPRTDGGVPLFPESGLFDGAAVSGANLGAALDTFRAQLANVTEDLRAELPFEAQALYRLCFVLGYVALGLLVGSMLVMMYEPIFSMAGMI